MPRNKVFTGPLTGYLRGLLEEKRSLGFKYDEQARRNCALHLWRGSPTGGKQRRRVVFR